MATRTDAFGFAALDWVGLLGFMAISHVAGALGGMDTRLAVRSEWYKKLNKSPANPPNWVFGLMWALLFTLMAVAVFLVWQDNGIRFPQYYNVSIALWSVMVVINAIWMSVFFGMQWFTTALVILILQLMLSIAVTILFFLQQIVAGVLMIPLCVWLCFATYLNGYVVFSNREEACRSGRTRV